MSRAVVCALSLSAILALEGRLAADEKKPSKDPPKGTVEHKDLPGIYWEVDQLFGPKKEFNAEIVEVKRGKVKWKLTANERIALEELMAILEAQLRNDPERPRMAGSYLAYFGAIASFKGVPIHFVDKDGDPLLDPIKNGGVVYGLIELPMVIDKGTVVKLR